MNSQIHPKAPPVQFNFDSLAGSLLPRVACRGLWRVGVLATSTVCATSDPVVVTSGPFHHAFVAAATEATQQLSEKQAHQDEDHGNHAGKAHAIGHEALLVHLQRKRASGVARTAAGEYVDQVEEG